MVKNSLGMEGVYSPDQPMFERNHNLTNLTGKQMAVTRLEEEESQNNIYGSRLRRALKMKVEQRQVARMHIMRTERERRYVVKNGGDRFRK